MVSFSRNGKSILRDYFEAVLIAVLFAVFVRTYVVQAYRIPTPSMEDNLLVGDHLLVNKFAYASATSVLGQEILPFREILRGDVIVFKFPEEPEKDYIKRVIGLPRETVKVEDGQVYIKEEGGTDFLPLDEPYAVHKFPQYSPAPYDNFGPLTVADHHYFVLGDNRDNSRDSRDWGLVPRDHIRGKAFLVYWSYELETDTRPANAFGERLQKSLRNMGNLFTRTRWNRTFKVIR
jgi:signal peptidase I